MGITYNGKDLVAEDAQGAVQQFIGSWKPMGWMHDHVPRSPDFASGRRDLFPLPNYPPYPEPRINQLYWPTGAARWAIGYFLVDEPTLAVLKKLRDENKGGDRFADLVIDDGQVKNTFKQMFMLDPKPLATVGAVDLETGGDRLFILPLVDQRYWWQFESIGDLGLSHTSTWAGIYSAIGNLLPFGVTIGTDSIDSNYLNPDLITFSQQYSNLAIALDAIAHSLGQRIIVKNDATVSANGWAFATTAYLLNRAIGNFVITAGGDLSIGNVPENVVVVNRKIANCTVEPDMGVYVYTKPAFTDPATLGDAGFLKKDTVPGTVHTIHSTAWADFTNRNATPDNDAALNSLATIIAQDYYLSLLHRYDYTIAGLLKVTADVAITSTGNEWELTAYDDSITYIHGRQRGDLAYEAHTRIQSIPSNFAVAEMAQQDPAIGDITMFIPVVGILTRAGKTSKNPGGGTYPVAEDNPNTYGLTFVDTSFTATMGNQTLTSADQSGGPHDFVHNLGVGYIKEGTHICVFWYQCQWYTCVAPGEGWITKTTAYTASPGDKIEVYPPNPGDPYPTITLPSCLSDDETTTPSEACVVEIFDRGGEVNGANPIPVGRNGQLIHGIDADFAQNVKGSHVSYVFGPPIGRFIPSWWPLTGAVGSGLRWQVFPFAYYKLNDDLATVNVIDSAGSNDGTASVNTNILSDDPGLIDVGKSFLFVSASSHKVEIDGVLSGIVNNTKATWTLWTRPTIAVTGTTQELITFADTDGQSGIYVRIEPDGKVGFLAEENNVTKWHVKTNAALTNDQRVHIAVGHNGVSPFLLVNSKIDQDFIVSADLTWWFNSFGAVDVPDNGRLGSRKDSSIPDFNFLGAVLDDVRIFRSDLSVQEIGAIVNYGVGTEATSGTF